MQFVHRRRLLPQLLRKTERAVTNPIAVQPQLFEGEPRCVEHHALGQPVPPVDLHRAGCPYLRDVRDLYREVSEVTCLPSIF